VCFYICKFAFKEEVEGGHSVSPNLGCELASLSRLGFVLHEDSSKGDYDWCWDFGRMRSCAYMKEDVSARGASFGF
jgi:hypothetical protein